MPFIVYPLSHNEFGTTMIVMIRRQARQMEKMASGRMVALVGPPLEVCQTCLIEKRSRGSMLIELVRRALLSHKVVWATTLQTRRKMRSLGESFTQSIWWKRCCKAISVSERQFKSSPSLSITRTQKSSNCRTRMKTWGSVSSFWKTSRAKIRSSKFKLWCAKRRRLRDE